MVYLIALPFGKGAPIQMFLIEGEGAALMAVYRTSVSAHVRLPFIHSSKAEAETLIST